MLRVFLGLVALAGAVVSLVLAQMSLPSVSGEASLSSVLCAPGEKVNCDYVLGSRWARVGPISAAQLGLVYFVCVGIWYAVVGLPNARGRRWHLVPLGAVSLGMMASIGFVVVMAVELPVWCTWCLAAHGINAVLFLATLWAARGVGPSSSESAPAYPTPTRALATLGGCASAFFVLTLAGMAIYHQMNSRRFQLELLGAVNNVDYIVWRHQTAPIHEIPVGADDLILGDASAPHTLVIFSDFECSACAQLHQNAKAIVSRFPSVRCVFKHYPVCRECNEHVTQTVHHFACEAARAAEAYRLVETSTERALAYHARLYDARDRFGARPYLELSGLTGDSASAFESAVKGKIVEKRVQDDIALAHQLGVVGTPTLFLNGRRLERWSIVTMDVKPQTDGAATLRLWEALVGDSSQANENDRAATNK